jgi:hypothetical protein
MEKKGFDILLTKQEYDKFEKEMSDMNQARFEKIMLNLSEIALADFQKEFHWSSVFNNLKSYIKKSKMEIYLTNNDSIVKYLKLNYPKTDDSTWFKPKCMLDEIIYGIVQKVFLTIDIDNYLLANKQDDFFVNVDV